MWPAQAASLPPRPGCPSSVEAGHTAGHGLHRHHSPGPQGLLHSDLSSPPAPSAALQASVRGVPVARSWPGPPCRTVLGEGDGDC